MKIITAISFLVLSFSAYAQRLKISGGISFCKLDWQTAPNAALFDKPFTTYTAGVGIEYLRTGILKLSSNIEYMRKGGVDELTYTDPNGNDLYTHNEAVIFSFVNANTYAKLKIPTRGKVRPFISLGVYAGYMVSANDLAGDIDEYKRLNLGGIGGVGVGYKIIGREIGIEVQYLPSFIPLYDKPSNTGATRKITDKTFTAKLFFIL